MTRVRLYRYRSHAFSDVALQPLSYLVGPNGSGKSNFLDALSFVSDSLRTSVTEALHDRGGFAEVLWRGAEGSNRFGFRIEFEYFGDAGHYAFTVVRTSGDACEIGMEECRVATASPIRSPYFRVAGSRVIARSYQPDRPVDTGALHLANGAGDSVLWNVSEHLRNMRIYRLDTSAIRRIGSRDLGDRLAPNGSNAASVLGALEDWSPETKRYVVEYLGWILPGLRSVHRKIIGNRQTLEFTQEGDDASREWSFWADRMSDGTLHALGVLLAAFQRGNPAGGLVGIDEPGISVSPSVVGILAEALKEASHRRQIVVSTQSPDLLDDKHLSVDSIVAVRVRQGRSHVGRVDEVDENLVRKKQATVGALMREDPVRPRSWDPGAEPDEVSLFGPTADVCP